MYENGKVRPVEIIRGIERGGVKENDEGSEFISIYKNFCKCHNVPPVQQ
jgi:hypothetical protein